MVLVYMSGGLLMGVAMNFGTLKLYNHVSWLLYANLIVMTVSVPLYIKSNIPPATQAYEESKKMLRLRYWQCKYERRAILARRVAALRPIAIYAGMCGYRLFKLCRITIGICHGGYVNYTFGTLLCVHI